MTMPSRSAAKGRQPLGDRTRSAWDFMALESVDLPAVPLAAFRQRHYGAAAFDKRPKCLPALTSSTLDRLSKLVGQFPRKPAQALTSAAFKDWRGSAPPQFEDTRQRVEYVVGKETLTQFEKDLAKNFELETNDRWIWPLFIELWDYLDPEYTHLRQGGTDA